MIHALKNKTSGIYSNITEKRINISIILCVLVVISIFSFLIFGDISVLDTHPVISMAVVIWILGFGVHNFILSMRYAQKK
jgi:hypothetical protein